MKTTIGVRHPTSLMVKRILRLEFGNASQLYNSDRIKLVWARTGLNLFRYDYEDCSQSYENHHRGKTSYLLGGQ